MDKFLYFNELFLAYKELLKDNSRAIFDLYYGENMTMQEIADYKNISKSRVGSIIKNVENKLLNYEDKLKIVFKKNKLEEILELNDINDMKKVVNDVLNMDIN